MMVVIPMTIHVRSPDYTRGARDGRANRLTHGMAVCDACAVYAVYAVSDVPASRR